MNQRNKNNKNRRARRFSVDKLWIVTASSIEEAEQICREFGIEPESVFPLVEPDIDCLAGAIEYVAEDPE